MWKLMKTMLYIFRLSYIEIIFLPLYIIICSRSVTKIARNFNYQHTIYIYCTHNNYTTWIYTGAGAEGTFSTLSGYGACVGQSVSLRGWRKFIWKSSFFLWAHDRNSLASLDVLLKLVYIYLYFLFSFSLIDEKLSSAELLMEEKFWRALIISFIIIIIWWCAFYLTQRKEVRVIFSWQVTTIKKYQLD